MSPQLVLRPMTAADEAQARAAHAELEPEGFDFLFRPELAFADQLAALAAEESGVDLPPGRVPATYLLADVDGTVVGRASIRHELNDVLLQVGGHIGYAVRPAYRRRGYATAILRGCLDRCRDLGLDRVLVTCDDDNAASATVIERCGGELEDVRVLAPGTPGKRRYWIELDDSMGGSGRSGA